MAKIVKTKAFTGILLTTVLAACQPAPLETVMEPTPIYSAQSIGPIADGISALAFAPNATIPWEGRLLIAPNSGGIAVYSIEGKAGAKVDGGLYTSLAVQPGFSIRDLKTSLILAVTGDNQLLPMIIDDARGQVFPVPVANLPTDATVSVCTLKSAANAPTFIISRQNSNLEFWQITDTGADVLQAKILQSSQLAIPMNNCASVNGQIFTTGIKGSIFAIEDTDKPVIAQGMERPKGSIVALAPSKEALYLLYSNPDSNVLEQILPSMQHTASLVAVPSLSNPAVEQPGALAVTDHSFGGAGFSAGLLAIADNDNNRVSLIVRDTLPGFKHDQEER